MVIYMKLLTPKPKEVQNKTVLMRVDYNVPLKKTNGVKVVVDDRRVQASLKTLKFLLDNQAKVILMSHLGRPAATKDPGLSLKPVADYLQNELSLPVAFVNQVIGEQVTNAVNQLNPGQALMLENLRFEAGEKDNDAEFAKQLAELADLYINEAFSTCHRQHASIVGVAKQLPAFAGFALEEEVNRLNQLMESPEQPLVIALGGAKISDKVAAVEHLSKIANIILVGGGVANSFLKAEGLEVYRSFIEEVPADKSKANTDYVEFAQKLIESHKTERVLKDGYIPLPKILYPIDVVAAPSKDAKEPSQTQVINLTKNMQDKEENVQLAFYDIGPKTIQLYSEILAGAQTIFWNGPMGVWENPLFAQGTKKIADAIANNPNNTNVGGGDTLAAIDHFGLTNDFSYVSAAGGAALYFLSGKTLPGIKPLVAQS